MSANDRIDPPAAPSDPVAFRHWYEARVRRMLASPDARIRDIGRRLLHCLECNAEAGAARCIGCDVMS